jgi:hypothetical protein
MTSKSVEKVYCLNALTLNDVVVVALLDHEKRKGQAEAEIERIENNLRLGSGCRQTMQYAGVR